MTERTTLQVAFDAAEAQFKMMPSSNVWDIARAVHRQFEAAGLLRDPVKEAERVLANFIAMALDVWQSLGLPSNDFHGWIDGQKVTPADAWAQLLAAISGSFATLITDTNPPAPQALIEVAYSRSVGSGVSTTGADSD